MKPHTVQRVSPLRIVLTNIAVIISHWSNTICWRRFYNDHLFPRLEVKSTALLHKLVIFGKKLYPGFSAQPSAGPQGGSPLRITSPRRSAAVTPSRGFSKAQGPLGAADNSTRLAPHSQPPSPKSDDGETYTDICPGSTFFSASENSPNEKQD